MDLHPPFFRYRIILLLMVVSGYVYAQEHSYEPQSGQAGKDVIWVPTPQKLVDKMLDMAKLTPNDYLMDLGSGDGRLVITAAKRGVTALGIEYNEDMVELSKKNAADEGVGNKAKFKQADLFEVDLSKATVITLFLLPELNLRLRPTLLDLKPGTRIVSNTFTMEEWQADETVTIHDGCVSWCEALLWIVPAKVEGTWKLDEGVLTLDQQFQMITGTLRTGNTFVRITDGRLRGNQITFKANDATYFGTVSENKIQGSLVKKGDNKKWSASR